MIISKMEINIPFLVGKNAEELLTMLIQIKNLFKNENEKIESSFELNNDVEITEVTRTAKTGRKVTPKYTSLYDRGETVTITTPTGENKNYILITIVAISFFVILGTGIVFIKKKILK